MKFIFAALTLILPSTSYSLNIEKVMDLESPQVDEVKRLLNAEDGVKTAFGISFYKIKYQTKNVLGEIVPASGIMIVPRLTFRKEFAMVVYHHGTSTHKNHVPSNPHYRETLLNAVIFGAGGYVVVAPDYVGLGDSPGLHPFLHVETQGRASADLIEESRKVAAQLGVKLTNQLLLTGYSQGGHATMSAHWYLEKNLSFFERVMNKSSVTASAPMAGPYDLSDSSVIALSKPAKATTAYVALLTLSMNQVYNVYPDLRDLYLPPYETVVPQVLDGTKTLDQVIRGLPKEPKDILQPAFMAGVQNDPSHPFRKLLALNDVDNWKARAPIRLFHGAADADVPFTNSEVAARQMTALGSKIDVVNVGQHLDHHTAILPAFIGTRIWFDQIRRKTKNPTRTEFGFLNALKGIHPLLAQ
ncbi:MAG: lipase family protein [Bdellovibrionales bacterium]|nr:lipase family protein [Bdellovibrionales bacterium]